MSEFRTYNRNIQLPAFKLGVNNTGINQGLLNRDLTQFYQHSEPKKPVIVPKQPQPNVFFTPIEDNREQVLRMMKKELDDQLEFTRIYLPADRR
jgi:hypothetical protein